MNTTVFSAALFDLDGVVFNTEPQYTLFWGNECRRYHPDEPGLEYKIKGQTLVQIFDGFFGGELAGEREAISRRLLDFERTMKLEYIDGFTAFLDSLKANGVATALVTSSNKGKMDIVFARRKEFQSLFDAVLMSEDFDRSKPDPDCYLKAAKRLGKAPADCIVLEDSFNGLKAGRAAGMRVVGLATTNTLESIAPLADIVINDFTDTDYGNLSARLRHIR